MNLAAGEGKDAFDAIGSGILHRSDFMRADLMRNEQRSIELHR
jgi:hypothetical protein